MSQSGLEPEKKDLTFSAAVRSNDLNERDLAPHHGFEIAFGYAVVRIGMNDPVARSGIQRSMIPARIVPRVANPLA